jgi:hypothetical protein
VAKRPRELISPPEAPVRPIRNFDKAAERRLAYCDQKAANREIRVWHFVIENGY